MTELKETVRVLQTHNKTIADIQWGGSKHIVEDDTGVRKTSAVRTTVAEFIAQADKNYDDSFGGAGVNKGLILVGKDFWLERAEYDGAGWWEYKTFPNCCEYTEGIVPIFNRNVL